MRNLVFVIWVLGWPVGGAVSEYLGYLRGKRYSEGVEAFNAIICIIIWILIGFLLYEKRP